MQRYNLIKYDPSFYYICYEMKNNTQKEVLCIVFHREIF